MLFYVSLNFWSAKATTISSIRFRDYVFRFSLWNEGVVFAIPVLTYSFPSLI